MKNPDDLEKALEAIRKTYGSGSVRKGNEYPNPPRITFGDIQLDYATGGGIPLGTWVHLYGAESTGKTLTALKVIANAQKDGYTAAFYDVEKTFTTTWAEKMGVDTKNLIIIDGTVIEHIGEALHSLIGCVNLHIIDSIAAAIPLEELDSPIEKWHMGLAARTWNKVLRKTQEAITKENSVILINQMRTSFNKHGQAEDVPTGGRFVRHEASLGILFRKARPLYKDKNGNLKEDGIKTESVTGDNRPDGFEFSLRVAKSKVCEPEKPARLRLDFETGQYDQLWSLAMFAIYFGLVTRKGSWYTMPDGENVQGETGIRTYIETHPEFAKLVRETVLTSE